jgi:hypothetical protein
MRKIKALSIIALAAIIGFSMASCPADTPIAIASGDTVISIAAITGVTAPEQGASPVTVINANAQYTGTVAWNGAPAAFDYATVYTATITLTPKSGYKLQGVPADFFTVEGAAAVNAANSGVITAVFPQTADDPALLHLSGDITIKPDTSVTVSPNPGFTVGMKLIAVYSGSETVSYHWKKDGADVGTDSDTYTPDEVGIYTVTVSAAGYNPKTSDPVTVGPSVVPEAAVLNVSKITDWDWLAVGADGSSMFFNVDKTSGIPTRLFLKPDKNSDNGFSYTFKENGLPDIMVNNGNILFFDNFDEYTFDVAILYPDGTIEYHYGIETEENFDTWDARFISGRSVLGGARSVSARFLDDEDMSLSDKLGVSLEILGHGFGIIACVTAPTNPASAVGCGVYVGSLFAKEVVYILDESGIIDEWAAGAGNLTIDGINLVIDALGCAGKNVQDCISAAGDLASMLIGDDLQDVASKIADLYVAKEEMESEPVNKIVNFHLNGGSGTVPASFTVEKNTRIQLPSGDELYRTGHTFLGWNTSPALSAYIASGSHTIIHNTSFYAKWYKIPDDVPTGVTATAASESSITVSWNPVSGASYYDVYRSTSMYNSYEKVGTVTGVPLATSYTDTGLPANATYYYKVSAYSPGAKGESDKSAYAYATTQAGGSGGGTAIAITTASLPNGMVGIAYSHTLTATGSTPITWSIESGELPAGLIHTAGVIEGTPETEGTSNFTVKAANAAGSATKQLSITITSSGTSMADAIPLTENQWANGNLPTSDARQWFVFTATASTQYIHTDFGSLAGLYVNVYASNGTTTVGSETTNLSTTSRSLTVGERYYIRVRPYSDNSGDYRIAFTVTPYPPDTSFIPLTVNQWANGNLSSGGVQWFRFTATASTQYIHAAFGTLSSTLGVWVQVYDSNVAAVGSSTNLYGSTTNTSGTLTPGQMYYIRVRPYGSGSGTYRIVFNASTSAPVYPSPSNPIPLTENEWAVGNLPTSSYLQWFVFTATASTQWIHIGLDRGNTGGVSVNVYDSNGLGVGSTYTTSGGAYNGMFSRTLTVGHAYYVKVSPGITTYRIAFNTTDTRPQ